MISPMPNKRLPRMYTESILATSYTQTCYVPIKAQPDISNNAGSVNLFLNALPHSLRRVFSFVIFLWPSVDNHGSPVIFRSVLSDPHISSIQFQTMITRSNSLSRGSGMPIQVDGVLLRALSGSELSRVRTELDPLRILPTVSPHPVQPNRESPGHARLGDVPLSTHRQAHIPSSPVRITACCGLGCFHQQETQQITALLGDVSQPLMTGTGILLRNQSHIAADLLAPTKPFRSSDIHTYNDHVRLLSPEPMVLDKPQSTRV